MSQSCRYIFQKSKEAVNFKAFQSKKSMDFSGKSSMEGRYGLYSQGSSGWTSMRNEEFQEEDVWAAVKERKDFNFKNDTSNESSTFTPKGLPSAAKTIPRANNNPTHKPKIFQQSAPVNIPDWSKIYGNKHSKKASKNSTWFDYDDNGDDGIVRGSLDTDEDYNDNDDEDDDGDGDGNMMPPHEWIAKKLAKSQITCFSVCEGVGRTLKGRDLSRVRDAVLIKTGFLE